MKKFLAVLLAALLVFSLMACQDPDAGKVDDSTVDPTDDPSDEPTDDPTDDPSDGSTDDPSDEPADDPSNSPTLPPLLPPGGDDTGEDPGFEDITQIPTNYVVLEMEGYGDILVELYPDSAPITVANFQKPVQDKAFDNTIFHRVVYDFVVQGGVYSVG